MERYIRNDDIIFSGNDADEYMNICNGVYNNDENRVAFQNYMSEHMKPRYDSQTGDVYLECDFINLDGIDTVMIECEIEHIEVDSEFKEISDNNHVAQSSLKYEGDFEYGGIDQTNAFYDDLFCFNGFIIDIEVA